MLVAEWPDSATSRQHMLQCSPETKPAWAEALLYCLQWQLNVKVSDESMTHQVRRYQLKHQVTEQQNLYSMATVIEHHSVLFSYAL